MVHTSIGLAVHRVTADILMRIDATSAKNGLSTTILRLETKDTVANVVYQWNLVKSDNTK